MKAWSAVRVVARVPARALSTKPLTVAVLGTGPVATAVKASVGEWASVTDNASKATYAVMLDGDFDKMGKSLSASAVAVAVGCKNAATVAKAAPKATVAAVTCAPAIVAASELAAKAGVDTSEVTNVISWGSGIPDISHAYVGKTWALELSEDPLPAVTSTPEAEAAAAAATIKALALGSDGKWMSMGVPAVGDFGTGEGIFYSVPVVCKPGSFSRVGGISLTPAVAEAMEASRVALLAEA
eukprot:CAMPEP_0119299142 /NCGR_PEP_ID=MMETSP1333-20130426/1252_1 /TAXON_ID=418940 /ORGANISM="Scyphosphaera apsteinii, Strain RCC1455" /LENGTH=240 /DNA_ID=CAMNT_0007300469 /DNA_START=41 /DNA_END=763 /DNA_ORIENTATION=-